MPFQDEAVIFHVRYRSRHWLQEMGTKTVANIKLLIVSKVLLWATLTTVSSKHSARH